MGGGYFFLVAFFSFFTTTVQFSPPKYSTCHSKDFGYGGTVCVCSDELECDSFSEGTTPLSEHEYAVYSSSKAGDRFSLRIGRARQALEKEKVHFAEAEVKFTVNQNEVFQTILGIGGAFTGLCRNAIWLVKQVNIPCCVRLFSNLWRLPVNALITKKWHEAIVDCVTDVLATLWLHLWSITEQGHGKEPIKMWEWFWYSTEQMHVESICMLIY